MTLQYVTNPPEFELQTSKEKEQDIYPTNISLDVQLNKELISQIIYIYIYIYSKSRVRNRCWLENLNWFAEIKLKNSVFIFLCTNALEKQQNNKVIFLYKNIRESNYI